VDDPYLPDQLYSSQHFKDDVMWNSSRRIALLGTFVVLVAGGLLGFAWVSDWLPISFGDADSGKLVDESDLDAELASLSSSGFDNLANDDSGHPDIDDELIGQQDEPIFEPVESPRSNEFADRKSWNNNRSGAGKSLSQNNSKTTPRDNPFADFPNESNAAAPGRSIPNQFPTITDNSNAQPKGRSPFETETEPHQLVDQASFASNARNQTGQQSGSNIFNEGQTRTLSDARSFPARIQQVANEQPTSAKSAAQSPIFEPTQPSSDGNRTSPNGGPSFGAARIVDERNSAAANNAPQTPPAMSAEQLKAKLAQVDQWLKEDDYVSAHRELSNLFWKQPGVRTVIQERLDRNSQKIYFSPTPHFLQPYEIQGSDLLQTIAPKYKLSWEYLAAVNQINPRRIRSGQKLKVIKGPFSAFVDLSDFELTIHCHGFYVKQYSIGIGKDNSSPIGKFKVLNKVTKPQYTDPNGRVLAGDDPNNPLGSHWIDIGNSFGLHGTLKPKSIGQAESRGCIRMTNQDVSEVYMFLTKDSEVVIRP
jgi:lipoprotein-anchoring transpeptidase ErfK/SrfK